MVVRIKVSGFESENVEKLTLMEENSDPFYVCLIRSLL